MRPGTALVLALLAGCATPTAAYPDVMAALGDSITRAVNAESPGERPASSWATGHDALDGVDSLAERLVRMGAPLSGNVHNFAVSGARARDLPAQARQAVDVQAGFVTILAGANDACARDVASMTSADDFRASLTETLRILDDGLDKDAQVLLVSVPDVVALHDAGKDDATRRSRWDALRPCEVVFSPEASDADRAAVRARIAAYNAIIEEVGSASGARTDGGAVHAAGVRLSDVSRVDGFHPSLTGQARLADVAWNATAYAHR